MGGVREWEPDSKILAGIRALLMGIHRYHQETNAVLSGGIKDLVQEVRCTNTLLMGLVKVLIPITAQMRVDQEWVKRILHGDPDFPTPDERDQKEADFTAATEREADSARVKPGPVLPVEREVMRGINRARTKGEGDGKGKARTDDVGPQDAVKTGDADG